MADSLPRLDILIYGHDGRGFGHVSRSAAIGMALRRLYPALSVCLITGSSRVGDLVGEAPLDWLKLPGYRTRIVDGLSYGTDGYTCFSDRDLGNVRALHIKQVIALYRPRIVLVDHAPQGKHRELVPALEASSSFGTRWILGVRGVIGKVRQTRSDLARDLFKNYYSSLLWYGDSTILGTDHLTFLQKQYGAVPYECGYVSRFSEVCQLRHHGTDSLRYDCLVSVPWTGEKTELFIDLLFEVLKESGSHEKRFSLFFGDGIEDVVIAKFRALSRCDAQRFGKNYAAALARSDSAVIFGGYNSVVDILAAGIPALVIARNMQDREQQIHLEQLQRTISGITVVEEGDIDEKALSEHLGVLLNGSDRDAPAINLAGAEKAAFLLNNGLSD